MNILLFDTSTQILSIALKCNKFYEERLIDGNFSHSEDLLTEVTAILERAKIKLADLDMLICTKGPGSFTGIRVGMVTMKGFASALSIPLVSVGTLEAIEESASLYKGAILSVIDAKKKRFYQRLSFNGEVVVPDSDMSPEDIIESLKAYEEVLVTGPDAALFAEKITSIETSLKLVVDCAVPRNLSKAMLKLGLKKYQEVGADDIGEGPIYIRRSDAEEALLKKKEEANG
ncbi:MAG: tRNA (adenosine(37)-N6)-threonylcarbamoyltransferase complex dimerization subunit type 1 TsaB [Spirochaetales bacterium]|nr:tRNA (adenosine(37)-N6)-threonylcarbamoyltransferase complex dimerization subunit type 1 TsaB [Spirochaetales bacterium]